jgi:hypothetical protein
MRWNLEKNLMRDPFRIYVSSNVQKFEFSATWDHTRHYQALFNGLNDVLNNHMAAGLPWGMIGDWRKWLVQIPESERVCVQNLGSLSKSGLTHYASVVEDHPISRWQHKKVSKANPTMKTMMCQSFEDAESWFHDHGFDTNFTCIPFKHEWLKASKAFDDAIKNLDIDKSKFVTTS